ncbi:spondin domain-containing protein [Granulosicoccus sp.]|nr:spondin domain-containing protein [Granulosicoccus sp.]MDB4224548.1 spondin domain-containing protein [Granulosicoccus sp.]
MNKSSPLSLLLLTIMTLMQYQPAIADSTKATYELEVNIDWSSILAPYDYSYGAHMSSLIGLTHNNSFVLFEDGKTASSGLELLAENGRFGILRAHFEELKRKDRIGATVVADGIKKVPGKMSTTFKTTSDHPLLSIATMLAPSPDWFTGVSRVRLYDDGKWLDSVELPLWVWDAGTDSGVSFISKNDDTQPRESIRLLSTQHFLNREGLIRFGTVSIKRKL